MLRVVCSLILAFASLLFFSIHDSIAAPLQLKADTKGGGSGGLRTTTSSTTTDSLDTVAECSKEDADAAFRDYLKRNSALIGGKKVSSLNLSLTSSSAIGSSPKTIVLQYAQNADLSGRHVPVKSSNLTAIYKCLDSGLILISKKVSIFSLDGGVKEIAESTDSLKLDASSSLSITPGDEPAAIQNYVDNIDGEWVEVRELTYEDQNTGEPQTVQYKSSELEGVTSTTYTPGSTGIDYTISGTIQGKGTVGPITDRGMVQNFALGNLPLVDQVSWTASGIADEAGYFGGITSSWNPAVGTSVFSYYETAASIERFIRVESFQADPACGMNLNNTDGTYDSSGSVGVGTDSVHACQYTLSTTGTNSKNIAIQLNDHFTTTAAFNATDVKLAAAVNAHHYGNNALKRLEAVLGTDFTNGNANVDEIDIAAQTSVIAPCGAEYIPSTNRINFARPGNGTVVQNGVPTDVECGNMSFDSVIYHELAHGFHDYFGASFSKTSDDSSWDFESGISEGYGDLLSAILLDNPLIAEGLIVDAHTSASGDQYSTENYMRDISQHYDYSEEGKYEYGLAWASFGWNLKNNLQNRYGQTLGSDEALRLIFGSMAATPWNTGVLGIPDALDALIAIDDNNADLTDGTPNDCMILTTAVAHKLPLPGNPDLQAIIDQCVVRAANSAELSSGVTTVRDGGVILLTSSTNYDSNITLLDKSLTIMPENSTPTLTGSVDIGHENSAYGPTFAMHDLTMAGSTTGISCWVSIDETAQQRGRVVVRNVIMKNHYGDTNEQQGGAIYTDGCDLYVENSTFLDNVSHLYGGAIWAATGTRDVIVDIRNSSFLRNRSKHGGALYTFTSGGYKVNLNVINSIFSDNIAYDARWASGYGVYGNFGRGGAMHLEVGTEGDIVNTTVTRNKTGVNGGISLETCDVKIANSIVMGNNRGEVRSQTSDDYNAADAKNCDMDTMFKHVSELSEAELQYCADHDPNSDIQCQSGAESYGFCVCPYDNVQCFAEHNGDISIPVMCRTHPDYENMLIHSVVGMVGIRGVNPHQRTGELTNGIPGNVKWDESVGYWRWKDDEGVMRDLSDSSGTDVNGDGVPYSYEQNYYLPKWHSTKLAWQFVPCWAGRVDYSSPRLAPAIPGATENIDWSQCPMWTEADTLPGGWAYRRQSWPHHFLAFSATDVVANLKSINNQLSINPGFSAEQIRDYFLQSLQPNAKSEATDYATPVYLPRRDIKGSRRVDNTQANQCTVGTYDPVPREYPFGDVGAIERGAGNCTNKPKGGGGSKTLNFTDATPSGENGDSLYFGGR